MEGGGGGGGGGVTKVDCQIIHQCLYCCVYLGVGTCVLGVILIWMNYYFYLTLFTMGEPWTTIVLFVFCSFGGCCVVWGILFYLFFGKQQTELKYLFLEDLAALRRAYKNYQLLADLLAGWLLVP